MQPALGPSASASASAAAAVAAPRQPHADLRSQLISAALHLLSAHGPTAVRMRDVAALASCSTMGVYTHFGSKQGLLDELFRFGFRQLADAFALVSPSPDPRASVIQLALAYRRVALANPALYALLFERAMPDFTPSDAARTESVAPFDFFVEAIRRCGVEQRDPSQVAYLFWCAVHGLVSIELTHRRWGGPVMTHLQQLEPEQAFRSDIQALLAGLLPSEPAPSHA